MTSDSRAVQTCHEAWRAFLKGATEPSPLALSVALATVCGLIAVCLRFVTPALVASDAHRYLAEAPNDDYVFVTAKALALLRDGARDPAVFILGASGDRESITSCGELAELVQQRCGVRPDVHLLAPNGLSVWEMAALADALPAQFDGIVVLGLGVNPPRWAGARADLEALVASPRLGFVSAVFDREIERAGLRIPWRTGNYLLDNRGFFHARVRCLIKNLRRGPVTYEHARMLHAQPSGPEEMGGAAWWDERIERARGWLARYDELMDAGLSVFARTAEALKARGRVSVVLVETPTNPRFIDQAWGRERYAAHQRRLTQFTDEHGLHYWDLSAASALGADEFHDHTHLRATEAQRRFTKKLADRLARLLPARPGNGRVN